MQKNQQIPGLTGDGVGLVKKGGKKTKEKSPRRESTIGKAKMYATRGDLQNSLVLLCI